MSKVNENIRKFRTFRKMTQRDLAIKLNKSTNVISNWENGIHSPDLDNIEEICVILDVTPDEIFGWEENQEYSNFSKRMAEYQKRINELQVQKANIDKQIHELEVKKFEEAPPTDFM